MNDAGPTSDVGPRPLRDGLRGAESTSRLAPRVNHLPPCCASCPELDAPGRACRLLAEPTIDNRHRLLTMPCDVPRLVRQRFRGHGEDISQKAMVAWLDPARRADDIARSYEAAPRDARLWLSAWPYRALVHAAIAEKLADTEPQTPRDGPGPTNRAEADPALASRTESALARLARIDAPGFAMMIDSLRGAFYATTWRGSLGATDAAIHERRALSTYRYLVLFFDVLEAIEPRLARSALEARRFVPGDPSDATALAATRDALGDKQLVIGDWRASYRAAVESSLAILATEERLGALGAGAVAGIFRRVLRVEDGAGEIVLDDASLAARLASHAAAAGTEGADDHLAPDLVASLSAGELEGAKVEAAARHLLTCRDRRCCALLRWEVGGREAVRRDLSGPMSEPPPGMTVTFTQGPSSQHLVNCRDVLWDAFTQMARAEGRSIDDLVNDAMARYRVIREYAAPPPPPKPSRTSSVPPRPLSTRPQARSSSVPPPPSRTRRSSPPIEDEHTPPEGAIRRSRPPGAPPSIPRPSVPPPPPVPVISDGELTREPATIRAPALQHPDPPSPSDGAAERLVPRPLDSSRTLQGMSPSDARAPSPPTHADRTVEISSALLATNAADGSPRPREEVLDEKLEQLPERSHEFSDAEDTSPKMNLSPLNPPLFVEYAGRRGHVNHPRFVIGRERTTCHLVLPDSNVSRQHAVVEWNNGAYYLVDLGSTNGVGCGGHRIHRKQIVEGDRFDICGHAITFSFRL